MAAFGFSQPVTGLRSLDALINVPNELRQVASHWPGSRRWLDTKPQGPDADGPFTLTTFTRALEQARTGQYQYLHVASHFVLSVGRPELSWLHLGDQNVLTLADIERLKLNFGGLQLVTLSACSTALDEGQSNGQEMQNLSSTMLRKGAMAVVATMWNVADTSTYALMQHFYQELKAGRNKAQALRAAQLALLRPSTLMDTKWQHPYFWAPMVLTGEWR